MTSRLDAIKQLYEEVQQLGSMRAVASKYGVTKQAVSARLCRAERNGDIKYTCPRRKVARETLMEVEIRALRGDSVSDIAAALRIAEFNVYRIIKQLGLRLSKQWQRRIAEAKAYRKRRIVERFKAKCGGSYNTNHMQQSKGGKALYGCILRNFGGIKQFRDFVETASP